MEASEMPQSGPRDVGQTTGSVPENGGAPQLPSARPPEAEEARRVFPPVRKLSDDQEHEVTRLYAETTTSVPEIATRFGVAESSVYRVARRHGASLRGRSPAKARPEQQPSPVSTSAAVRQARPHAQASRTPRQAAQAAAGSARRAARSARSGGNGARRFRVRFEAEIVLAAEDIRDALRKAEARGATEITEVRLED